MPIPPNVQRNITALNDVFEDEFRPIRRDGWKPTVQRRMNPAIPPQILAHASDGFSITSPLLEKTLSDHIKIITGHPPEIDVIDQEGTEDSKRDTEKIRLFLDNLWHTEGFDHGKRLTRSAGEGQMGTGAAVWWLRAEMPSEYEGEDGDDYEKRREDYYRDCKPWRVEVIDPMTCAWGPKLADGEFEAFVYDCEVDHVGASELIQKGTGKKGTELFDDKRDHLGSGQPTDGEDSTSRKRFHFVHYEEKDKAASKEKGYDCWKYQEWLYPDGETLQQSGEMLSEGKLPMKRCSFHVIEAGEAFKGELVNPHLRLRPKMYPLIVAVTEYNMWNTLLAAMTYQALTDDTVVVNVGSISEEGQRLFEQLGGELGAVYEGAGAMRQATVRLPRKNARDEINAVPGPLERWPLASDIIPAMQLRLEHLQNEINDYRVQPGLLGGGFDQILESTATLGTLQIQSAGGIYGPDLEEQASAIEKLLQSVLDCIEAWDEATEAGEDGTKRLKQYGTYLTGEERRAQAGKAIDLTAEQVKRRHTIRVRIKAETLQEQQLREQRAVAQFQQGFMKWEDLLKELGQDDPLEYSKQLAEEANLVKAQAELAPIMQARRFTLASKLTGLNLVAIQAQTAQLLQPMLPPPDEGGAPMGGGGEAERMPRPNPGISPPALEGAAGASR